MTTPHTRLERRLGVAGALIVAGLLVQLASSTVVHPLAFVAFALVACPLVLAGVVVFLWSLVASRQISFIEPAAPSESPLPPAAPSPRSPQR